MKLKNKKFGMIHLKNKNFSETVVEVTYKNVRKMSGQFLCVSKKEFGGGLADSVITSWSEKITIITERSKMLK